MTYKRNRKWHFTKKYIFYYERKDKTHGLSNECHAIETSKARLILRTVNVKIREKSHI